MKLIEQARVKIEQHKLLLRDTILDLSFQTGEFTLSSGKKSDYYIDLRKTTMDSHGIYLMAEQLWWMINSLPRTSIGGVPLGSIPIVGAVLTYSRVMGAGVTRGFMIRSKVKKHGTQRRIEGHLDETDFAVIIEDVVTSGKSVLEATRVVGATGAAICEIIAVVDREEGGREAIEKAGYPFRSIFTTSELKRGLVEHEEYMLKEFHAAGTCGGSNAGCKYCLEKIK